jgi:CheY-like chemotaxis protein
MPGTFLKHNPIGIATMTSAQTANRTLETRQRGFERSPPTAQIVLVEDEEMVLEVIVGMLAVGGITPRTTATSAEELLADPDLAKPDLLITNITLGAGMDGFTLAETLRRKWPNLAVLYISGRFPQTSLTTDHHTGWLSKPFTMAALLDKVGRLARGGVMALGHAG